MATFSRIFYSLLTVFCLAFFAFPVQGQIYLGTNGNVSFFSKAPLEDIEAHSTQMSGVVKPDLRELAFSMPVKSFLFKKSLMQEHFNEEYLETDKYPRATFAGKILENVDLSVPGTYKVNVQGKLAIHGVSKDRTLTGTVVSDGNKLQLDSEFKIKVADHNVTVPKLVFENIAEVVDVKLKMTLNKK
jgi:hypothetical protein